MHTVIKMESKELINKIEIPSNIEVTIQDSIISTKGPQGEFSRKLFYPGISIYKDNSNIVFKSLKRNSKREKAIINTYKAHIKNMIKGALENFTYVLKISQSHFPINVSIEGTNFMIKNFLGEKIPRKAKIVENAKVEIKGDEITITSINKEAAGQTAGNIELATRLPRKDRRKFGDGIFIVNKPGHTKK